MPFKREFGNLKKTMKWTIAVLNYVFVNVVNLIKISFFGELLVLITAVGFYYRYFYLYPGIYHYMQISAANFLEVWYMRNLCIRIIFVYAFLY